MNQQEQQIQNDGLVNVNGKLINENVKAFVQLKDINKIYPNGVQAVYDFNIDIHHHDFIVLVGPSGCGKSTTLRMVAGLEDISSGSLYIGKVLSNYVPSKDRDISMVFQSYALYPQMSVYENIAFPLKARKYDKVRHLEKELDRKDVLAVYDNLPLFMEGLQESQDKSLRFGSVATYISTKLNRRESAIRFLLGFKMKDAAEMMERKEEVLVKMEELIQKERTDYQKMGYSFDENTYAVLDKDGNEVHYKAHLTKSEIREKVFDAARILDLGPYLDRKPKELSGGQMQRVALGRAIVRNAKLFLMDEPLSNLDAKLRVQMRSEIVRIHEQIGATTIYVTHDQTEAMTMATRIAVMSKGWVQQIDVPSVIYNQPNNIFVATFIGSPAMNIFDGIYENGVVTFQNGFHIAMPEDYQNVHDNFYRRKIAQTKAFLEKPAVKRMHGILLLDELVAANDQMNADIKTLAENKKKEEKNKNKKNDKKKEEKKDEKKSKNRLLSEEEKLRISDEINTLFAKMHNLFDQIKQIGLEIADSKEEMDINDGNLISGAIESLDWDDPKSVQHIMSVIRKPLYNICGITSKELSILHNAEVFNKDKKKEGKEEVLFYNKRKGKAKKAVKGYKNVLHVKDSKIILTNNLYLVLTTLLERYESYLTKAHSVSVGIRPEHIHLASEYSDSNRSDVFVCKSDVVELLGSELLLHSNFNDVEMIAKISTGTLVKPHEDVQLCVDRSKVLLFDENGGDTIADWVKAD